MSYVAAFFAIPALALMVLPFVGVKHKGHFAVFLVAMSALMTGYWALRALNGDAFEVIFDGMGNAFVGQVPVRIDRLSAWFILVVDFVFVTGALYAIQYLKLYRDNAKVLTLHYVAFVWMHSAVLAVCTVQNSFVFLIAWEIMAVTAFVAVIFEHGKIAVLKAGLNYLIQSHLSIVFLMVGFIWVAAKAGSFDFQAIMGYTLGQHPISSVTLFLLFFVGFGIKAGFVPLHTWLPQAHPAAPSHISGIMSGVVVKAGIYGIMRIIFSIHTDFVFIGGALMVVSVAGGLFGILNASLHRDIKRMLAYCTVENIGIIGLGMGVGLIGMGCGLPTLFYLGFGGALLHVLNHALFKSLLFYSAGAVYQQTHTRDMDKLGGLFKLMPQTGMFFLVGAVAIGGMPPLNGFVSEFVIFSGLIEGIRTGSVGVTIMMVLSLGGLSMIGGLSIVAFTKMFGTVFLGTPRTELAHKPKEVPFAMLLPQYFIVAAMLWVALMPGVFYNTVIGVMDGLGPWVGTVNGTLGLKHAAAVSTVSGYSLLVIALVLAVWAMRYWVNRKRFMSQAPTWGCAYVAPNSRMQYTGKSFAKPLGKMFNFLVIEDKRHKPFQPGEIFPQRRKYLTHYLDFFEHRLIDPIVQRLLYAANYFKFIQNGKVQWYVLYGIMFIVTVFVFTYLSTLVDLAVGLMGNQ